MLVKLQVHESFLLYLLSNKHNEMKQALGLGTVGTMVLVVSQIHDTRDPNTGSGLCNGGCNNKMASKSLPHAQRIAYLTWD